MRIGLLYPYTGSNLGDGSIHQATIHNIRARVPDAEIIGINLWPAETERRHQIAAFPIMGASVEFYSTVRQLFDNANNNTCDQHENSVTDRRHALKTSIKRVPLLGSTLRWANRCLLAARNVTGEVRHLGPSYAFVKTLDLLLVPGGGQLDEEWGGPWGHPYALFRWAILARTAGVRMAVLSVGTGRLNSMLSRYFVQRALAIADYRSYRDPGSKVHVEFCSYTSNDPCVPDLAFSYDLPQELLDRPLPASTEVVAISPISYGDSAFWPTEHNAISRRYFVNLVRFAHQLIQSGKRVMLFTSSGADRQFATRFRERLREEFGEPASMAVIEPPVACVDDLLRELAKADIVVASRLHGVILSHILRKPVLAVSWDRKVEAHMEGLQQSAYCVDIREADCRHLFERYQALEKSANEVRKHLNARIQQARQLLAAQYDKVLSCTTAARKCLRPASEDCIVSAVN